MTEAFCLDSRELACGDNSAWGISFEINWPNRVKSAKFLVRKTPESSPIISATTKNGKITQAPGTNKWNIILTETDTHHTPGFYRYELIVERTISGSTTETETLLEGRFRIESRWPTSWGPRDPLFTLNRRDLQMRRGENFSIAYDVVGARARVSGYMKVYQDTHEPGQSPQPIASFAFSPTTQSDYSPRWKLLLTSAQIELLPVGQLSYEVKTVNNPGGLQTIAKGVLTVLPSGGD